MPDGLANRAWRALRGAAAAAPGGANTRAVVNAAVALTQRFAQAGAAVGTGVTVAIGALTQRTAQTPAVALTTSASGTPVAVQTVGIDLDQRLTQAGTLQTPAAEIVQVRYDLTSRKGGAGATVVGTGWTSPANAEGLDNSSVAAMAGAVGAQTSDLTLPYADFTGKTDLTILSVELRWYVQATGIRLANGSLALGYRVDGATAFAGATVLDTQTAGFNNLGVGAGFDISAAIGQDWSKLNALVAIVRGTTAAAAVAVNLQTDAVVVTVTATRTDLL